jgi:asparagine synthase (glutamine-hydrolysing)
MCGLAGLLATGPADPAWLGEQTKAMIDSLVHRGPDDSGVWVDGEAGVALGFRRLSIIDLSQLGHQPMGSASGRYTMVFNGEVFNHKSLRSELLDSGAKFRGHSDTEVMLAAFEAWGISASIRRFVGMFAIAAWDAQRRELHLVRDRLGIKPLHVAWKSGTLLFGSELRSILAGPAVSRDIDPLAALQYLRYLYVPGDRSILQSVRKLPPGHHLVVRDVAKELPPSEAYWSLPDRASAGLADPVTGSDAEVVAEFDQLLQEAVALRMEADVPLGALLSGGIDSSTVVALMQAASSRPVKTYSIGFPGTEHDEGPAALAIAKYLGTDHHELPVDDQAALALAVRLAEHNDEPFADPSQIPTMLVCELARNEVTVALTGDGGDELFGGYNRYLGGPGVVSFADRFPGGARRALGAAIGMVNQDTWDSVYRTVAPVLPKRMKQRLPGEKVRKLGQLLRAGDESQMYRSLLSVWQNPEELLALRSTGADPFLAALDIAGPERPLLDRAMLADQMIYLPDDLLTKVDRMSMAVSLEARVPILDHRVVEYSWRLRPEHKIRDGKGKWLLREVLYRRIPRELVDRPKVGFTAPIATWLKGALRPWAEEQLSPARMSAGGILDGARVQQAWQEFHRGHTSHAPGLWAIIMLQAWLGRFGK